MRYGHLFVSVLCAWVAWSYVAENQALSARSGYQTQEAFPKYSNCNEYASFGNNYQNLRRDEAREKGEAVVPRTYVVCLPDTVDPRAPKEGK
jgi:hypothetical protein